MKATRDIVKTIWENKAIRISLIGCGIIVSCVAHSILEEQIMKKCYEQDSDGKCVEGGKYESVFTFLGIMTATYALIAKIFLQIKMFNTKDETHRGWYMSISLVSAFSLVCATIALRWIAYPVQVIARSSKPISVMFFGLVLGNKRYTVQKYFFVLVIVGGVVMFIYDDRDSEKSKSNQTTIALILVVLSVFGEGVVGVIQDRMRKITKPSPLYMMFYINICIALFVIVTAVITGEIFDFKKFVERHPEILLKITCASLVGSLGQIFIFMMVSGFGALACSIATTTRKLFTVLISVTVIGNALSLRQGVAVVIVFGTLFADAFWGKKKCGGQETSQKQEETDITEKNDEAKGRIVLEMENSSKPVAV